MVPVTPDDTESTIVVPVETAVTTVEVASEDRITIDGDDTVETIAVDTSSLLITELLAAETVTVPIGDQGPPGPVGPRGPAGGATSMIFTQDIPSDTWVIPHTFTYDPSVTVQDTTGAEVAVAVSFQAGLVIVQAAFPFAGRAVLMG